MLSDPFPVKRNKEKKRSCTNGRDPKKALPSFLREKDLNVGNGGRETVIIIWTGKTEMDLTILC